MFKNRNKIARFNQTAKLSSPEDGRTTTSLAWICVRVRVAGVGRVCGSGSVLRRRNYRGCLP